MKFYGLGASAFSVSLIALSAISLGACSPVETGQSEAEFLGKVNSNSVAVIEDGLIRLEVGGGMALTLHAIQGDENVLVASNNAANVVRLAGGKVVSKFEVERAEQSNIQDELGVGVSHLISGVSSDGLRADVNLRLYTDFPGMIVSSVSYTNVSEEALAIEGWAGNNFSVPSNTKEDVKFWSFQGSSHTDRRDWVQPLGDGYSEQNFMGMNASDYGGGTPVIDVWREDVGLAVGHIETVPKLVSLPISVDDGYAHIGVKYELLSELAPGESFETFDVFAKIHTGDYYESLKSYSAVMAKQGLAQPNFPDTTYEPIWCAWGYERGFNVEEVLATLPKAKELGLQWAVLDDGWQTAEGDWYLNPEKFPKGDKDMIGFVDQINDAGLKAKLWWAPLAVDPGTDLLRNHSDMLLLDEWGAVHDVTWWNSFYLCPAYEPTVEHSKKLVREIMGKWGYSGLKIDGQHLNSVAPCYNPEHGHERPEESVEAVQEYWRQIYETAIEIDPEAVVEICPCGTSYAFHNTPYMNQSVASDPLTSWQIRHKGKTLKALTGDNAPYYADHVELSDEASDFATAIGIGAVVGTKFTWPTDQHPEKGYVLTPEKEEEWGKWISVYTDRMLSKGIYKGELYDIGFDSPETHAVEKDGQLYYAFYSDDKAEWQGSVELRGLSAGKYRVVNYINGEVLGEVSAAENNLDIAFVEYLLVTAELIEG